MKSTRLFLIVPIFSLKLCINCKHYKKDIFTPSKYAQCKKYLIVDNNVDRLIDGKKTEEKKMLYCSTARKFDHLCGEEGTGYDAK
jgi:hypothetical protein